MSKETPEKKQYPSQLNSKTISARIPINDYVEFLKDSLSKGISLNDWLLMKIYNTNKSIIGNNSNSEIIEFTLEDLHNSQFSFEHIFKFYKHEFENSIWIIDKETILELLGDLYNNTTQLQNYIDRNFNNKVASLSDVKLQLSILINNKFPDTKTRKEFKSELFELLNELS
jgi:hypothetical protein